MHILLPGASVSESWLSPKTVAEVGEMFNSTNG